MRTTTAKLAEDGQSVGAPLWRRLVSGASLQSQIAVRIGAHASQMYGVLQVPVCVTEPAGRGRDDEEAQVATRDVEPDGAPRSEAGKTRAIKADAGAWYEPWISPMTIKNANNCQ